MAGSLWTPGFGQDAFQVSVRAKDHFAHVCIFSGKGAFQALRKDEQGPQSPTQIAHRGRSPGFKAVMLTAFRDTQMLSLLMSKMR